MHFSDAKAAIRRGITMRISFSRMWLGFTVCFITLSAWGAATPPITFTSGPTATPATAGTGQTITFTVASSGGIQNLVAYSWTWGDGTTDSGASVQHTYRVAGTYMPSVTASDGTNSASATVTVTVTGPILSLPGGGDTLDSDGDGFSDGIEGLFGSDPHDASSTPTGSPLTSPSQILALTQGRGTIKIYPPGTKGSDSISLAGSIPAPANHPLAGAKVVMLLGQFVMTFTLADGVKGTSSDYAVGKSSLAFKFPKTKTAKIEPRASNEEALFLIIMVFLFGNDSEKNELIADLLFGFDPNFEQPAGQPGARKAGMPVTLPCILLIGNTGVYSTTFDFIYTKKQSKGMDVSAELKH